MQDQKNQRPSPALPCSGKANVLAVITARGGSKGLPGKHVRLLGGKPLIAWTIEAALGSGLVRRVLMTTDDDAIARISKECGASVPFRRPFELAMDNTQHLPVVIHAAKWLEDNESQVFDYIMLLQPTTPLRSSEDINAAIRIAYEKGAESVTSVSAARSHPYLCKTVDSGSVLKPYLDLPPETDLRRQSLPPVYELNGAIYLTRRDVLLERNSLYGRDGKAFGLVMPPERSIDIDDEFDFQVAELAVSMMRGKDGEA